MAAQSNPRIVWFEDVGRDDVANVGGKNASLGELVRSLSSEGIRVPPGFATTAEAYWTFVQANGLEERMRRLLADLDEGKISLEEAGKAIRELFLRGDWPEQIANEIVAAYRQLCERAGRPEVDVAIRSSATAEDLPGASFAGQQETFLNIRGERALLAACRRCYASLFTDRAISYRKAQGFDHMSVALSIGVQQMVRSDIGGSGVMFSIDTETGFKDVVLIDASWGLGENVVQGIVDPDEYQVFKPLLANPAVVPIIGKKRGSKGQKLIYAAGEKPTRNVPTSKAERMAFVLEDTEILTLARWAAAIEAHYACPMDMEWAKDGETGEIFIVQARPETVQSRRQAAAFKSYRIVKAGRKILSGLAVGDAVVAGRVCLIEDPRDIGNFVDGAVLVTRTTDPDWVPVMKRAAAIVTDHGGRTSHAAIVSRELGLPAIVGAGNATALLHDEQEVTVSCAEGDQGFVYEGTATFEAETVEVSDLPQTRTQLMLNLGNPAAAMHWWRLPSDGVGLARMEFVVSNHIRVHPMALLRYDELKDEAARREIAELTVGYPDKAEYFVDRLARGLARIAAALYPKPVIVRMSDFKTNEYAGLVGGAEFEPKEENPMIGFRGAARYYSPRYRDGFALECRAVRRLRNDMGFCNVVMMIPFCRSTHEADRVLEVMAENGLRRGEDGLEVFVMCEVPSNVILAAEFAKRFDGFSIGSNDLTQLTLGVDRDSADLAALFDEQDQAVKWMISSVIAAARKAGAKIGLCGQAPSDHPEFAAFLVECGIDSISVSPDSFIAVKRQIAAAEAAGKSEKAQ
ncbi:phosphoenolpyruvate synthase [Mesorhizobium sp.]|uniref:phosphoenolpyruvate synthase n=1 Tax=Mesorhizobium sp. TaxID=1871066 RepID=UPI000FE6C6B4|nr:phosphoenolpyruvate synthase [Mesorhizobium sp.]RWM22794.1 MAG: phosphoenolpyruvate synthase [Mesorhizobium sp.]RWM33733.1 MAG: phosphoenolpyruvate synthase [Mesorhizobium sp.]TIO74266.1 MAG: phosphoenolpyruvate synthase [Mesorhizobium sp.]TIO82206.1 MAG: phosphoenolpyruvate synthase [Mesorhizobium sp.]TJV49211.1 MAG: phosphoenolpyruvate synthase [Mesorhizobium sp.]